MNKRVKQAFLISLTLLYLAWILVPTANLVFTTFKLEREVMTGSYHLLPREKWVLNNYVDIWKLVPLAKYLVNSLIVSLITMLVAVTLSSLAGYALSRFRFAGKPAFTGFVLLTQTFPGILFLLPYYMLFVQIERVIGVEVLGTYPALIFTYSTFALPFAMLLMRSYFDSIPRELEEAAMIDGCSRINAFLRVIVPLALPGVVAVGILGFLRAWNDVMFALLLTDENTRTVAVGITDYASQFEVQWHFVLTAGVVVSIPAVVFFILLQKYMIQGLTAGAVKG